MSRALDALLFGIRRIFKGGVEQPTTSALDLIGDNWATNYNTNTGRLELQVTNAVDLGTITRTLWVDAGYMGGSSDGSQGKPFTNLQDAVDAVPVVATNDFNLTQILVAPGTYTGNPQVLANQQIIFAPLAGSTDTAPFAALAGAPACSVIMTGHFVWTLSGGAAGASLLYVKGFQFDGLNIAAVAMVSAPQFSLSGCVLTGAITTTGTYNSFAIVDGCGLTDLVLPDSVAFVRRCSVSGTFTPGPLLTAIDSHFAGDITLATFVGLMNGCGFGGASSLTIAAGSGLIMDSATLKFAGTEGLLPAPTDHSGGGVWQGDGAYYSYQHTVRYSTGDVTADLGDETVYVNGGFATTKTVTLPEASMFTAGLTDTVGGTDHTPARHIRVKNVCDDLSSVVVAASGSDLIDGAAVTQALPPQVEVTYTPLFDGANWRWESNHYRTNSISQALAQTSNNTNTFSDKLVLTTSNLNGIYKVEWDGLASSDDATTICESRLINDTTSTQLGSSHFNGDDGGINFRVGGFALVTFTAGVSTTLKIQFRRAAGGGNTFMENVTLIVSRVWV